MSFQKAFDITQGIESATKNIKILQEPTTQFQIPEMLLGDSAIVVGNLVIIQISVISNLSHVITVASWATLHLSVFRMKKQVNLQALHFVCPPLVNRLPHVRPSHPISSLL